MYVWSTALILSYGAVNKHELTLQDVCTGLIIWAAAEAAVVISAASIPFMRPLLLKACQRIRGRHIALSGEGQMSGVSTSIVGSETRWIARGEAEHNYKCILKKFAARGGEVTSSASTSSNT